MRMARRISSHITTTCATIAALGLTFFSSTTTPIASAQDETVPTTSAKFPQAGDAPIAFSLEDTLQLPAGAEISWEAFKGDVVLLEFWATWCGPCVGAIPHLNQLAEHFAHDDVRFVAVTMEKRSVVENFLDHKEMASWIGMDTDKSMFDAYGVTAIPRTYLIDRDGSIAAITHPDHLKAEHIQNLLDRKDVGLESMQIAAPNATTVSTAREIEPIFEIYMVPSEKESTMTRTGSNVYEINAAPLRTIASFAYSIEESRIDPMFDLPDDRYHVRVIVPQHSADQLRPLLQTALETTFGFASHWEERDRDVYVLARSDNNNGELGKGITKAFESTGSHASWSEGSFSVGNYTIDGFLDMLEQVVDRPIVNETNLEGKYDISIFWDGDTDALVKALNEQLNMKLTPATRSVKTLVISKNEELSSTR